MKTFSQKYLCKPLEKEAETWLEQNVKSSEDKYERADGERHEQFVRMTEKWRESESCRKLSKELPTQFFDGGG